MREAQLRLIRDGEAVVHTKEPSQGSLLTEDDQADRYRYRCPETFRWKSVPAAEVAIYSVRPAAILSTIADLLGIAQALRKGIDAPLLDDALWHLGKARIGHALTDVWLVRGLAHSIEEVFRHFSQTSLPDQGLILSSGGVLPQFVRPPRSYRFASLREAIVNYVATPCIDMDLLHRILVGAVVGTSLGAAVGTLGGRQQMN